MKTRLFAAFVAALMLAMALPVAAMAQTDEVDATEQSEGPRDRLLEELRERVLFQLDRRLDRIDRLQFEIRSSDTVEPEHAAHLTEDLASSHGGLTALEAMARSATTFEQLRAIQQEMVTEHRIFALRTPQTGLVLASDFGVSVAAHLGSVGSTLAEAAARVAEAGYDVSDVEALIAEATDLTADGLALVDPVAETVLPLEPAEFPDPARSIMESARDDMIDGRQTYRDARDSLRAAGRLLADIVGSDAA
jgi:hypothetical protein